MLQPVITSPSAVFRAAPPLYCENPPAAGSLAGGAAPPPATAPGRPYSFRANGAATCVEMAWNSASCPFDTSTRVTDKRRLSELDNDALQQRDELPPDAPRRLHDLGVVERLGQHAGRHVRDAGNSEHVQSHMPRDQRFRHGGHPDRVSADRP